MFQCFGGLVQEGAQNCKPDFGDEVVGGAGPESCEGLEDQFPEALFKYWFRSFSRHLPGPPK